MTEEVVVKQHDFCKTALFQMIVRCANCRQIECEPHTTHCPGVPADFPSMRRAISRGKTNYYNGQWLKISKNKMNNPYCLVDPLPENMGAPLLPKDFNSPHGDGE